MAAASAAPPSSFAAVLRRSKFASFDPAIQQVYTTHGGHAYRGDWGLKRLLPLRRRGARITVQGVDSRAQQTEWKSGERQGRWVKMWAEVGQEVRSVPYPATPNGRPHPHASWHKMCEVDREGWTADSDSSHSGQAPIDPFIKDEDWNKQLKLVAEENKKLIQAGQPTPPQPAKPLRFRGITHAVPNVEAMTERQFAKYERELRARRPDFVRYMEEKNAGSPYEDACTKQANHVRGFLTQSAYEELYAPTTSATGASSLAPLPHPTAGLNYAHAPPMQQFLTGRPIPGRLISSPSRERPVAHVAVAGTVAGMKVLKSGGKTAPSEGLFRVSEHVKLFSAPSVVGRSQDDFSKGDYLEMHVQAWDEPLLENPHPVGSRAWVAWVPPSAKPKPSQLPSRPGGTLSEAIHRSRLAAEARNRKALDGLNKNSYNDPARSDFVKDLSNLIRGSRK